jgi:hypothetical protein
MEASENANEEGSSDAQFSGRLFMMLRHGATANKNQYSVRITSKRWTEQSK